MITDAELQTKIAMRFEALLKMFVADYDDKNVQAMKRDMTELGRLMSDRQMNTVAYSFSQGIASLVSVIDSRPGQIQEEAALYGIGALSGILHGLSNGRVKPEDGDAIKGIMRAITDQTIRAAQQAENDLRRGSV